MANQGLVGLRSAHLGEGRGSPGMLSWSLGSLCREEGSDHHPEVTKRDFSGPLEAAGMSRKCEQNEDNKQVGLFMCFKYILS